MSGRVRATRRIELIRSSYYDDSGEQKSFNSAKIASLVKFPLNEFDPNGSGILYDLCALVNHWNFKMEHY